jgi:prevent-host-death family protein
MNQRPEIIGSFEAKTHFSKLLDQVENGEIEEFIITKHGRPVARLLPISNTSTTSLNEAIEGLKRLSNKHLLGDLNWKELRDAGRRTYGV